MFTYVYWIVIIEVIEINSNFNELFIIDVTNRYINIYRRYIMLVILMINVPYSGHTNPTLPLAEALVKRGHNVVYVNSNEFKDKIKATGAKFIPYINFPDTFHFIKRKPDLNIVNVPEFFQAQRDTYGENYIFTIPPLKPMNEENLLRFLSV